VLQTSAQPPAGQPIVESAPDLSSAFVEESAYSVDGDLRRVEVPVSTTSRFFRIRGVSRLELRSIGDGVCTLQFEW
jgi:hypothetical protein